MTASLVVLAAGKASRFGRPKQLEPVGPRGATLLDYAVHDAARAGFGRAVFVVRAAFEDEMRRHVEARFAGALDLAFVRQELDDLPRGRRAPAGREKPWGTAHAVLAGRSAVDGPFAVCNADDFYGAAAHRAAMMWIERGPADHGAVLGYRLDATLSDAGGVSRAVCSMDARGDLRDIVEVRDVEARDGTVWGVSAAGTAMSLHGDERVSMNYWVFPVHALDLLAGAFDAWLDAHGTDPRAECLLPDAVSSWIASGVLAVRVIPVEAEWLGMTFVEDARRVADRLAVLHAEGVYPAHLGHGAPTAQD